MRSGLFWVAIGLTFGMSVPEVALASDDGDGTAHAVVPIALEWRSDGTLLVALRDGRGIAVVDTESWRETARWPLAFRPATLAVADDGRVVVGGLDGELAVLDSAGKLIATRQIGRGAVHAAWIDDERIAAGATWSRRVSIYGASTLEAARAYEVEIEPGVLLAPTRELLVVADAFRGRFVLLDLAGEGPGRIWPVETVNIRDLLVSPDGAELLFVGMTSAGPTQLTRTSIDWGQVLSSKLAAVAVEALKEKPVRENARRARPRLLTLDGSKNGAADPAALVGSSDGQHLYVAASGAHQILHVDRALGGPSGPAQRPLGDTLRIQNVFVGDSPTALTMDPTGRWLASADSMSDTLTVIETESFEVARTVSLAGGGGRKSAVQRGEALFRDGRLALDRWITCASCHPAGHTIGLSFDTLGDGAYGNPKNTPSLLGAGETGPWGWTGRFATLEAQVDQSLRTSLHGRGGSAEEVDDLVAYLRSLEPTPVVGEAREDVVSEGRALFEERRCQDCHTPPRFTTDRLQDGGLDATGVHYSPPSLRMLGVSAPYFHDGASATIEDALKRHHPGFEDAPTVEERRALRAFLESL